jgi:hypothetical protein
MRSAPARPALADDGYGFDAPVILGGVAAVLALVTAFVPWARTVTTLFSGPYSQPSGQLTGWLTGMEAGTGQLVVAAAVAALFLLAFCVRRGARPIAGTLTGLAGLAAALAVAALGPKAPAPLVSGSTQMAPVGVHWLTVGLLAIVAMSGFWLAAAQSEARTLRREHGKRQLEAYGSHLAWRREMAYRFNGSWGPAPPTARFALPAQPGFRADAAGYHGTERFVA